MYCTYISYCLNTLVYVIVRVAVVFGIDCMSNAGRKLVIVRGAPERYYCSIIVFLLVFTVVP